MDTFQNRAMSTLMFKLKLSSCIINFLYLLSSNNLWNILFNLV